MSKKLIAGAGVVASFAIALAPLATFADTMPVSDQHTDQLVTTVLPSCTFGSARKTGGNYPGGITHDDSTSTGYAAITGEMTATAWNNGDSENTPTASDTGGALHDGSGNTTNHNDGDVASSGYGILNGESGVVDTGDSLAQTTANKKNASEHTVHRSMYAGTATDTFASTTMLVVCNYGAGYSITVTASDLAGSASSAIPVAASYSTTSSGYNLKTVSSAAMARTANGADQTPTWTEANTDVTAVAPVAGAETLLAKKANVTAEAGDSLTVVYGMGISSNQKADTYAGTVVYKLYKGVNGSVIPQP